MTTLINASNASHKQLSLIPFHCTRLIQICFSYK